jgi:hypothetical protein
MADVLRAVEQIEYEMSITRGMLTVLVDLMQSLLRRTHAAAPVERDVGAQIAGLHRAGASVAKDPTKQ